MYSYKRPFLLFILLFSSAIYSLWAEIQGKTKELGAIWFIGDSITQSNADKDDNGSPRKALYDILKANQYNFSFTGHHNRNIDGLPETGTTIKDNLYQYHSGVSGILIGDTIHEKKPYVGIAPFLPKAWEQGRLAEVKPHIILILLGANDVNRNHDLAHAPRRLRKLLNTIYQLPGVGEPTIFLGSITPNRKEKIKEENVITFNNAIPQIVKEYQAKGKKIHFVDIFTPINKTYEKSMNGDNLHPNAVGNKLMAEQWFKAIKKEVR